MMKYFISISFLLLPIVAQTQSNKGNIAPSFSLPDERGEMITLDSFKDKVVFLLFWEPKHSNVDFYKEVSQLRHRLKNYEDIAFVHIAMNADYYQWLKMDKPEGVNLFNDTTKIDIMYGVDEYIYGVVIGKNGRILGKNIDCDAITDYILIRALDGTRSKNAYWKIILNSPDKKTKLYLQEKIKSQQDTTYSFQKI